MTMKTQKKTLRWKNIYRNYDENDKWCRTHHCVITYYIMSFSLITSEEANNSLSKAYDDDDPDNNLRNNYSCKNRLLIYKSN